MADVKWCDARNIKLRLLDREGSPLQINGRAVWNRSHAHNCCRLVRVGACRHVGPDPRFKVLPGRVETIIDSLKIGNPAKSNVTLQKSSISDAGSCDIRKFEHFIGKI